MRVLRRGLGAVGAGAVSPVRSPLEVWLRAVPGRRQSAPLGRVTAVKGALTLKGISLAKLRFYAVLNAREK